MCVESSENRECLDEVNPIVIVSAGNEVEGWESESAGSC
jgi:hypothetical protein